MLHTVAEGEGPRVVLVHGFTQTLASWEPLAARLRARWRVVRADLPGHGGSAAVRADPPTMAGPLFATLPAERAGRAERLGNGAAGLAAALRLLGTGTQEPLWARLPELAAPVLLVAGELDGKFAAVAERMAGAIGPRARVALVPGAGHAAHLEQPEAFGDLVESFLDEAR